MQQAVFEVLAKARVWRSCVRSNPKPERSRGGTLEGLSDATAGNLAIHRRVSKLHYSRRCAEASTVQTHPKQGFNLAPGMEMAYVVRDAKRWEVDPARTASEFDPVYYRGPLEKAWDEAAFVFG